MPMPFPVPARLRRLAADRRGAISPLIAFAIVALVGFVGIATDTARAYFVKARLSQALDAAALAGGRAFFDDTRDADIQMYFDANFPPGFMGADVSDLDIDTSNDAAGDRLDLSASATVPTTFMRLAGVDDITVSVANQVTRQTNYLDVVLSVDLSTSMTESAGGTSRIAAARTAATSLVDILFGENETKDLLKIGLVPWTAKVNVTYEGVAYDGDPWPDEVDPYLNPITRDEENHVWRTNNSPVAFLTEPDDDWKGCVYARFRTDKSKNNAGQADTVIGDHSASWGEWVGYEPVDTRDHEPTQSNRSECRQVEDEDDSRWGNPECTPCYTRGITPLTDTKQTVLDAIDDLQVNSTGTSYTNIAQGLLWAWNVITPEPPFDEADADPEGKRVQAIVLLTDGINTGWWGDAYKADFGRNDDARDDLDDRLETIAANIKSEGIRIYAIQFGDAPDEDQVDLMKAVASDPDGSHYFYAPDAAALNDVFEEVANSLSELRLSK